MKLLRRFTNNLMSFRHPLNNRIRILHRRFNVVEYMDLAIKQLFNDSVWCLVSCCWRQWDWISCKWMHILCWILTGYNDALDGRIPNEFATAAFRIGHTLLQERLRRSNDEYQFDDSLFLSQVSLDAKNLSLSWSCWVPRAMFLELVRLRLTVYAVRLQT